MPITGSQKALTYSLAGVMRAGASRSGYFPAIGVLTLGGTTITSKVVKPTIAITDELDSVPNTARMTVRGSSTFTPLKGQEIIIGLGNQTNRIFAGHVMNVTLRQPKKDQKLPLFDLDCVDYTWQLDWKRVAAKTWSNTAIGTIVSDLVGSFAPAFTVRVEAGMTSVDFQSNHDERLSEALSRLLKMGGGYWYVDYDRIVHAFINAEPDANLTMLTSSNNAFWDFQYVEDVSQTRTRVRVTGGSSTTTAAVAAGSTTLAVDDVRLFGSSGGYALVGANQITYTGKSVTEGPGSLTGIPSGGAGAIVTSIAQGDSVRVLAIQDDATAAATLAALVGTGDGYVEYSFEDSQLGDAAARQAAAGDLSLNKDPDKRLRYVTTDLFAKTGKVISVSLTNAKTGQVISGTYRIQRVVIDNIELSRARYPRRTVDAGKSGQNIFMAIGGLLEN